MLQFHRSLLRRPEARLMMLVIIVGMTALSAVHLLIMRLDRGLVLEATRWVGADLAISSTQAIPASWQEKANEMGLRHTLTAEFPSVVFTDDELKLAAIKAVGPEYPLKGQVKTSAQALVPEANWQAHAGGPPEGQAWVENGILQALNIETNETFSLGAKPLTAGGILQYEPDRHTNFYSFSPRVLISWADLEAAKIIQPGSRVTYRLLLALDPESNNSPGSSAGNKILNDYQTWLASVMRPGDKVITASDDQPTLSRASERLKLFLNTSLWLTLSMTFVGIALACQHLCHNLFPTFRTLYYLGLTPKTLYAWFGLGLLTACLLASAVGAAIGGYTQTVLATTFALRLPDTLNTVSLNSFWLWFGYGALAPMSMGLASFHTHLNTVLKRRSHKSARSTNPPGVKRVVSLLQNPFICLLLVVLVLLLNQTLSNWQVSGGLILGISALTGSLFLIYHATLTLWSRLNISSHSHLAALNLMRLPQLHFFQMLAFVVTVMSGSLAWSLGQNLLSTWQTDLPPDTPNVFVINLLPQDKAVFSTQLADANIAQPDLYPIVRGRLTAINGSLFQQAATKESDTRAQSNALQRDLNFTFRSSPPTTNPIIAGQWWDEDTATQHNLPVSEAPFEVSVESKLAEELDITVGDTITVTIGANALSAKVTNLREVAWESFQPNFYFVFQPRAMARFAHTYMGSFYLPPPQAKLLPTLAKQFPSVNFFDVKALLKQADTLLQNLGQAIWVFGGLTALIGAVILFICSLHRQALLTSLGTTLLAMGATLSWQKRMLRSEALILWSMSMSLGFIIAEAIRLTLAIKVFETPWQPALVPIAVVGSTLAGLWWLLTQVQIRSLANSQISSNLRR